MVVSAGTLLTAFGLGGSAAIAAGLYYLAHTTFAAAALFLLTDILRRARGDLGDRLAAGPGLPQAQLLGGLFLLIAVAATGVPPLSGFMGKFLILQAAVDGPWMLWVFAVVLVSSLLAIIAMARAGSRLFFKVDDAAAAGAMVRTGDLAGPVLLVLAGIALVVFAEPAYEFSRQAAEQLVQRGDYLAAVLQSFDGETVR